MSITSSVAYVSMVDLLSTRAATSKANSKMNVTPAKSGTASGSKWRVKYAESHCRYKPNLMPRPYMSELPSKPQVVAVKRDIALSSRIFGVLAGTACVQETKVPMKQSKCRVDMFRN